ncbi:MAG: hypothetical protein H6502_03900 [Candidatus Woesearchaeota archaeon]|nr:MAG: hypothetical protein H6502_03900 [Candidatus Woesearchaeota archaeon]
MLAQFSAQVFLIGIVTLLLIPLELLLFRLFLKKQQRADILFIVSVSSLVFLVATTACTLIMSEFASVSIGLALFSICAYKLCNLIAKVDKETSFQVALQSYVISMLVFMAGIVLVLFLNLDVITPSISSYM